jgi:hypothetical protein
MQTGSPEHITAFKAEEVKRLTESSWSKKISAELVRSSLPRMEALIEKTVTEQAKLQEELDAIDEKDHTRETREKKKALETKIEGSEKGIAYVQEKIEQIMKQVTHLDEQSQAELARAKYMEENFPACLEVKDPAVVEPVVEQALKA